MMWLTFECDEMNDEDEDDADDDDDDDDAILSDDPTSTIARIDGSIDRWIARADSSIDGDDQESSQRRGM